MSRPGLGDRPSRADRSASRIRRGRATSGRRKPSVASGRSNSTDGNPEGFLASSRSESGVGLDDTGIITRTRSPGSSYEAQSDARNCASTAAKLVSVGSQIQLPDDLLDAAVRALASSMRAFLLHEEPTTAAAIIPALNGTVSRSAMSIEKRITVWRPPVRTRRSRRIRPPSELRLDHHLPVRPGSGPDPPRPPGRCSPTRARCSQTRRRGNCTRRRDASSRRPAQPRPPHARYRSFARVYCRTSELSGLRSWLRPVRG